MIIEGTTLIKIEDGDIPADGHFIIPPHITAIGDRAFKRCTKLTAVTFNEGLTQIGVIAFWNCTGLTVVNFNKELTQIGTAAFMYCASLTTVTFNKGLTQIGNNAFWGCKGLAALTLNEQLNDIGVWAFADCPKIKAIAIATKSGEVYDRIKKLLPCRLKKLCMEMSEYEQLLAVRTEALKAILAQPKTNPIRRCAKSMSNFPKFLRYNDFWRVLNQVDPENNPFYSKAKRLMKMLPWPAKRDKQGIAAYREQCQIIVKDCLDRAKKGFFANSENTEKSQKSADLNHQNDAEALCKKIKIGF